MPQCPQCNKPLIELSRQCPSCRADLDLLVDYVHGLQSSLVKAQQFTRDGELGQAVWAYLEVLEVDPDNPAARHQVGQVATAVRQFDRTTPGRRWAQGLPPMPKRDGLRLAGWIRGALFALVVLMAFVLGYLFAGGLAIEPSPPTDPVDKKAPPTKPPRNPPELGLPPG